MMAGECCRACLSTGINSTEPLCPMDDAQTYVYGFCTSVEVAECESLPRTICRPCFDMLDKFYAFKRQCIQSNMTLLERLERLENPPKEEIDDIKQEEETDLYDPINTDMDDIADDNFSIMSNDLEVEIKCEKSDNDEEYLPHRPSKKNKNKLKKSKTYKKSNLNMKNNLNTKSNIGNITKVRNKSGESASMKNSPQYQRDKINGVWEKYPCSLCDRKFFYLYKLKAHAVRVHNKEEADMEIHCKTCDTKFKSAKSYAEHREQYHPPKGPQRCSTCDKIFPTEVHLKCHIKTVHLANYKKYVCHICGMASKSSYALKLHEITHAENRPKNHKCETCGKCYMTANILKTHMQIHTEKNVICEICHFRFISTARLKRHMISHMAVKPFLCKICNKRYSTRSFLTEHGRIHAGVKPYPCEYCNMCFVSRQRMLEHRLTHTGEKRYHCPICNHGFIQRGTYNRHVRTHQNNPNIK